MNRCRLMKGMIKVPQPFREKRLIQLSILEECYGFDIKTTRVNITIFDGMKSHVTWQCCQTSALL